MDMRSRLKKKVYSMKIYSIPSVKSVKLTLFCLFLAGCWFPLWSQQPAVLGKWWIELTDKNESPFSLSRPEEFLSARSLERRHRAGAPVLEEDLPVNPQYLSALDQMPGIVIHGRSRWLNAVSVVADSASALALARLPFVQKVSYIGRDIRFKNPPNRPAKRRTNWAYQREAEAQFGPMGYSLINLAQAQVPLLYEAGARGQGIWIAVMDGGFVNADTMPMFDSVALDLRLWAGPDFVERDRGLYESAQHGTSVLSVMAGNLPGYFVGAAPDATYFLLKTEDTGGEFPIEEANWISGAEWADSIGVDIINASLGYTTFSDARLGHRYEELDGRSSIGARGASVAARKGMIVCNSAGNSGNEPWRYVGVPADAPGVIAVGALVAMTGEHAEFSSYGPTADGRIKPDLSIAGEGVVTAGAKGLELTMSAGTSIASPIMASSLAALWSACPNCTANDVLQLAFDWADQRNQPDNIRGYGLPDFAAAWLSLQGFSPTRFWNFDNATRELQLLSFNNYWNSDSPAHIINALGQTVWTGYLQISGNGGVRLGTISGLSALPKGWYCLQQGARYQAFGR
jgi:serine protease AprX